MVSAALLLMLNLEYCQKADPVEPLPSKVGTPILLDPPSEETAKQLSQEDFLQASETQEEFTTQEEVENFYQKLLMHQGKEIYLVHAKGCPMDQVFYCFSEQELQETLAPLMEAKQQVETSSEKEEALVEGYLMYDHVEKIRLDAQKIKEILEDQSIHPSFSATRELWRAKSAAFEKLEQ